MIFSLPVLANISDHIDPNPQSDKCVEIIPERSKACVGRQLMPDSNLTPTMIISCDKSEGRITIVLTHRPMATNSSAREVRLKSENGELTSQWLVLSDTQSILSVSYHGAESDDYLWIFNMFASLFRGNTSIFGYSFDSEQIEGVFQFSDSDRSIFAALSCG